MMLKVFTLAALLPLAMAGYACEDDVKALVAIAGPNGVAGTVTITQKAGDEEVNIAGKIAGLSPNAEHGFHIHAYGNLTGGCNATGGHYNPFNRPHGAPWDHEYKRHVGDLGNIKTDANGVAEFSITDCIITLCGRRSVAGRGVVVHAGTDDLGRGHETDSLTTGHAGSRAGCGIIGIV